MAVKIQSDLPSVTQVPNAEAWIGTQGWVYALNQFILLHKCLMSEIHLQHVNISAWVRYMLTLHLDMKSWGSSNDGEKKDVKTRGKANVKKCISELPTAFRNYCLILVYVSREATWNYCISEQFQQNEKRRIYLPALTSPGHSLSRGTLMHVHFLGCEYVDVEWVLRHLTSQQQQKNPVSGGKRPEGWALEWCCWVVPGSDSRI